MLKPRKFDIEDSNIASIGTALDHKIKEAAAQGEPAWQGAGKEVGIQIWRIEKFKVVAWPKEQYGHFYTGDSYILLRTYKDAENPDKLKFDVHFWIGKNSTQDEYGTAAYKTVELDDFLHGDPVQHREIQGNESQLFLSYFKEIYFHEGGVESGFHHVGPKEYKHRMLHVKSIGPKNVVVREVPISAKSMNSGDVFIYDGGLDIYVLLGKECNPREKHRAAEFVQALAGERANSKHKVFEEVDPDAKPFWEAIGGKPEEGIAAAIPDTPDKVDKKLFRLSDETGKMLMKEVKPFTYSSLSSDDVFVLDAGFEIFCWVGKSSSKDEKSKALAYATDYLFKNNRPKTLPVSRILEGSENDYFKKAFD
jgi:gelsolin